MDVLVPDPNAPAARRVVSALTRRGHMVHHCRTKGQASACAVLENRACPLDHEPIDVALCVGPSEPEGQRGDGATCAAVRRVPLVLVNAHPGDPLVRFAAAVADEPEAATAAEEVAARPLAVHTAVAAGAMARELESGEDGMRNLAVEVHRRRGTLVVELWRSPEMSRPRAEQLAAHVVQAVRDYDGWARAVDVRVREPETDR